MHIWGWMSPEELEWLGNTAAAMSSVVEIGSLRGRSAFALLTACSGPVYCIDPWDDPKAECLPAFMEACGDFPNLVAIQGFSPEAGWRVLDDVDMVFIDGNHDYYSVMADIEYWWPRTKKVICGHDYGRDHGPGYEEAGFPGVRKAVDEFFGRSVEPALLKGWDVEDSSIWTVRR